MTIESTFRSYNAYAQDLSTISNHLVESQLQFLNFDDLAKHVLDPSKNNPKTADMIALGAKGKLCLVEFKGVTQQEILAPSGKCSYHPSGTCESIQNTQKLKGMEIVSSVKLKAIESWVIIDQQLCNGLGTSMANIKSEYYVVINMPLSMTAMINSSLAGKTQRNLPASIIDGLAKYRKTQHRKYYYDLIDVVTPEYFKNNILRKLRPVQTT